MSDKSTEAPLASLLKKRVKALLITFAIVLAAFTVLYVLTENESTAPFVYAIF